MRAILLAYVLTVACGNVAGPGPVPAPADGGKDAADAEVPPLPRGFGYRGAWRWASVATMPPLEFNGSGVGLVFDTDPPQADVIRFAVSRVDRCAVRVRQDGARFTIAPGQSCSPPDAAPFSGLHATVREGSFQMIGDTLSGHVVWSLSGVRSTLNPPSKTSFTAQATLEFGPLTGSSRQ